MTFYIITFGTTVFQNINTQAIPIHSCQVKLRHMGNNSGPQRRRWRINAEREAAAGGAPLALGGGIGIVVWMGKGM
jgi:hypothetical protein